MSTDYLSLDPQTAPPLEGGYLAADPYTEAPPAGSDPYAAADPYAATDPYATAPDPYAAAHDPYAQQDPYGSYDPYAATMQQSSAPGELSVHPPMLEQVQASPHTVGAVTGELSALVLDVEVPVEVYFGDAALTVEEFLELGAGSVVELDHEIDAPIELRVRDKIVARGQLVTINGKYGLRILEMVASPS